METGSRKQKFGENQIRSNLYTPNCSPPVKLSLRVHEQLFQLKCGLFDDKTDILDIISLYIGKILTK